MPYLSCRSDPKSIKSREKTRPRSDAPQCMHLFALKNQTSTQCVSGHGVGVVGNSMVNTSRSHTLCFEVREKIPNLRTQRLDVRAKVANLKTQRFDVREKISNLRSQNQFGKICRIESVQTMLWFRKMRKLRNVVF